MAMSVSGILAGDGGFGDAPVRQLHPDRIRAGDHMLIVTMVPAASR